MRMPILLIIFLKLAFVQLPPGCSPEAPRHRLPARNQYYARHSCY
jgi:hypothetical protein